MNRVLQNKKMQIIDGFDFFDMECENAIARIDDNKFVIIQFYDTYGAGKRMFQLVCEELFDEKFYKKLLRHDDLMEIRLEWERLFGEKLK